MKRLTLYPGTMDPTEPRHTLRIDLILSKSSIQVLGEYPEVGAASLARLVEENLKNYATVIYKDLLDEEPADESVRAETRRLGARQREETERSTRAHWHGNAAGSEPYPPAGP